MLEETSKMIFWKLRLYLTIAIIVLSVFVWYFFEEDTFDTAQAFYFFIGAYSQIFILKHIFQQHKLYDTRVIFLSRSELLYLISRISKWHSLDFIIKINSYITVLNQTLNLIVFMATYFASLCKDCNLKTNLTLPRFGDWGFQPIKNTSGFRETAPEVYLLRFWEHHGLLHYEVFRQHMMHRDPHELRSSQQRARQRDSRRSPQKPSCNSE